MAKKNSTGKFIVIEGIDGCGKGTQVRNIVEHLRDKGVQTEELAYPDREGPIGSLIDSYLHRKHDFSKEVQFLLYFTDFLKDKNKKNEWLENGKTIISDRYFTSTLAYQCLGGIPVKHGLKVAEYFKLPIPDLIVFLDIDPQVSWDRKMSAKKGKVDRHEADLEFQKNLANIYRSFAKKNILSRWAVVNGELSQKEVFEEIKKHIESA